MRYFQTTEKRGVFIRPEKLEQCTSPTPPSTSPSTPTLPNNRENSEEAILVGDTVLYNGKVGTVRFSGSTEFKVRCKLLQLEKLIILIFIKKLTFLKHIFRVQKTAFRF